MPPFSIDSASALLRVAFSTLRLLDIDGRIFTAFGTLGGHRRYAWIYLQSLVSPNSQRDRRKRIIGYARVSSYGQKDNLGRQAERLRSGCRESLWGEAEIIRDLDSGLSRETSGRLKCARQTIFNTH
jgi:predicted site-specific integrase-resolvase